MVIFEWVEWLREFVEPIQARADAEEAASLATALAVAEAKNVRL